MNKCLSSCVSYLDRRVYNLAILGVLWYTKYRTEYNKKKGDSIMTATDNTKSTKLVVKLTPDEKKEVLQFADEQCLNLSALVRKLLFEHMSRTTQL